MGENKSLMDVGYEQIKDNFYYALFGDFRLVIDKNTGCFNATKLCQLGGKKRFADWKQRERSKRLIRYYENKNQGGFDIYEIKGDKQISGQYVRQELILDIASWISVEFYYKCMRVILNHFVNKYKTMNKNELEMKLKEIH